MNTHTLAFYYGILRVSHILYMSKGHVLAAMAMVILQCDAIWMFFGYTFIAIEFYLWFAIIEFEKISKSQLKLIHNKRP